MKILMLASVDMLLRLLTFHHPAIPLAKCPESVLVALLLALSNLLLLPSLSSHSDIANYAMDVLAIIADSVTEEARSQCIQALRDRNQAQDPRLQFIFGYSYRVEGEWLQSFPASPSQSGCKAEEMQRGQLPVRIPYVLRRWEMVQEATPLMGENDTSLSLSLFGAREVVF